jgi:hypothetical protein
LARQLKRQTISNPTRITGRWSFDDQSEKLFLIPFTALFFMGKRGRKDLLAGRLKRNYQNRKAAAA